MQKVLPIVNFAISIIFFAAILALIGYCINCFYKAIKKFGLRRGILEGLLAIFIIPPILFGTLFAIGMGLKALAPDWFAEHDKLAGLILLLTYALLQSILLIISDVKSKF